MARAANSADVLGSGVAGSAPGRAEGSAPIIAGATSQQKITIISRMAAILLDDWSRCSPQVLVSLSRQVQQPHAMAVHHRIRLPLTGSICRQLYS